MFLVNDTLENRQNYINSFVTKGEFAAAVILAAADFEWTIRRSILGLGASPTAAIKEKGGVLYKCSGLDGYNKAWSIEVKKTHIVDLKDIIPEWDFFSKKAYNLRHVLVHGESGTVGKDYAMVRISAILNASKSIVNFADKNGLNIYSKLPIRRRSKIKI